MLGSLSHCSAAICTDIHHISNMYHTCHILQLGKWYSGERGLFEKSSICKNLFVIFSRAIAMQKGDKGDSRNHLKKLTYKIVWPQNKARKSRSWERHTLCSAKKFKYLLFMYIATWGLPFLMAQFKNCIVCMELFIRHKITRLIVRLSKTKVEYEIVKIKSVIRDCQNQKCNRRLSKSKFC